RGGEMEGLGRGVLRERGRGEGEIASVESDGGVRVTSNSDRRGSARRQGCGRLSQADPGMYANGRSASFGRDQFGQLSEAYVNQRRWARFEFSANKSLTCIDFDGDTISYDYDSNGRVSVASNAYTTVKRKYDQVGRIIEENQNGANVKFG